MPLFNLASPEGQLIESLRADFNGRASGLWEVDVEGNRLIQVAFAPAPDMPVEVAQAFAKATQSIPLDRLDLGVVKAIVDRSPAVSIAKQLPAEAGSGYWLRAFGAERSLAVPLRDSEGKIRAVLSIALPEPPRDLEAVIQKIQLQGESCRS